MKQNERKDKYIIRILQIGIEQKDKTKIINMM